MKKQILKLLLFFTVLGYSQTNPTPFSKIKVTAATKKNNATREVVQDSLTKEFHWKVAYPKEVLSNKQNSLAADGTATKYPTVDAVNAAIGYVTFEMFGAVGDGVTDDTVAIQNTVNFAGTNKIEIHCYGNKNYVINSVNCNYGIVIKGNSTIRNKFTSTGFTISPPLGTDIPVLSIGTGTFPSGTGKTVSFISVADGSLFKQGDILFINSNDTYIWDATMRKAELVVITGIIGNDLYLTKLLVNSFTTNVSVRKLSNEKVVIDGLNFTYDGDYLSETSANIYRQASLIIKGAINPVVNAIFYNDITSGLYFYSCFNPVADVTIKNLRNNLAKSYYGYGAACYGASRGGLIKVNANGCRHAYTNGSDSSASKNIKDGNTIDVTVTGVATNTTSASWDLHPGSISTIFQNCTVLGNATNLDRPDINEAFAFQDRGFKTLIINPIILGGSLGFAFVNVLTNYGEANFSRVSGGYSDNNSESLTGTGIYIPSQVSPYAFNIYIDSHNFTGYGFALNTQLSTDNILEYNNSTIDFKNIAGVTPPANTLGLSFKNIIFKNAILMDFASNNLVKLIGCSRINSLANVIPIRISTGSNVTIDNYTTIAISYNSNHVIRAVDGLSTLYLGYVSSTNFSGASILGTDGTGSFTLNNISKTLPNNTFLQGTVTTNTLLKSTGTNAVGNSNISDNGTIVTVSSDVTSNGIRIGKGSSTSDSNTLLGASSMLNVSSGTENTSVGKFGLEDATSASWNTNVGNGGLRKNTGNANTSIGYNGLGSLITGNNNVSIGFESGRYIADGVTLLTNSASSVFIGHAAKANGISQSNQIVIGQGAIGAGSNTATFGNTGITSTILRGTVDTPILKISTVPTTSAGTYDMLTRNTSTGVVEKKLNSDFLHTTGDETKTGNLTMTNPIGGGSKLLLNNNNTTTDASLTITSNTSTSVGSQTINTSSGIGVLTSNNSSGIGNKYENISTGKNLVLNNSTAATGVPFTIQKNSVDKLTMTDDGGIQVGAPIRLKNYTVATLPAGVQGDSAYVTDALAPSYLVTIVGGGTVVTPVFYNGSVWIAH